MQPSMTVGAQQITLRGLPLYRLSTIFVKGRIVEIEPLFSPISVVKVKYGSTAIELHFASEAFSSGKHNQFGLSFMNPPRLGRKSFHPVSFAPFPFVPFGIGVLSSIVPVDESPRSSIMILRFCRLAATAGTGRDCGKEICLIEVSLFDLVSRLSSSADTRPSTLDTSSSVDTASCRKRSPLDTFR